MRSYGYYHCHNSSRHGNEIDDDGDYISDSNCNNESESVDDACKDGTVGTESSSSQPCVFQEDFKIYSYIPFIVGKNKNY